MHKLTEQGPNDEQTLFILDGVEFALGYLIILLDRTDLKAITRRKSTTTWDIVFTREDSTKPSGKVAMTIALFWPFYALKDQYPNEVLMRMELYKLFMTSLHHEGLNK
jgi:hypothetical protein